MVSIRIGKLHGMIEMQQLCAPDFRRFLLGKKKLIRAANQIEETHRELRELWYEFEILLKSIPGVAVLSYALSKVWLQISSGSAYWGHCWLVLWYSTPTRAPSANQLRLLMRKSKNHPKCQNDFEIILHNYPTQLKKSIEKTYVGLCKSDIIWLNLWQAQWCWRKFFPSRFVNRGCLIGVENAHCPSLPAVSWSCQTDCATVR